MGSNPEPPSPGREYAGWNAGTGSTPEILPPEGNAPPTPPPNQDARPPQRRRPRWSIAPGTYVLLGINIAVFALMTLARVNPITPRGDALMVWGANNAGSVLVDGQWWRIVTAMFVHGGILHLALNMWCLWNLGLLAEPLMGTFGIIAVYVLTGATGNLLSILFNWIAFAPDISQVPAASLAFPPGVGASGAVFGIAGALIVLLKSDRLPVPPEDLKKIRKSVIYFAAVNLVLGFGINFAATRTGVAIDNWAHLGGCASGLLFAVPMVPRIGWPAKMFNTRLRIAVAMLTGILVLFSFYLTSFAR